MFHSWRRRLAAWFTIASSPSHDVSTIHRVWGVLGLLVGSMTAIRDVADVMAEPTAPWRLASVVFAVRGLVVAGTGLWIAVRLPWRDADEATQRIGFALNVISTLLLVPAISSVVFEPEPLQALWYHMTLAFTLLQGIWMSKRGLVRFASGLLTVNLIIQVLALTALDTELGRIGAPFSYSLIILIAGLLVRWWFGLAIAFALPACVAVLGAIGLLPAPPNGAATVIAILVLSVTAGIIALYTRALNEALDATKTYARHLHAAENALREQNEQLTVRTTQLQAMQISQQRLIQEQASRIDAAVRELRDRSIELRAIQTPLIRLAPGVLIAPLIGAWDLERANGFLGALLRAIETQRVYTVILDVTALTISTSEVALMIKQAMESARLMGCRCTLVGVQPEIAEALVSHDFFPEDIDIAADLAGSVRRILRLR